MDGGGDQGNDDGYGDPYGGMSQGDYEMQQRYGLSPGAMSQQQGPSSDQISEFMEEMQKGFEDYFSNLDLQWKRLGRGRYEASGGQISIKKDYRLSLEAKNTFAGSRWASWRWECHGIQTRLVRPKFLIQSRATTA